MYNKSTANILLNAEKLKTLFLRPGIGKGCPLPSLSFNVTLEVLAGEIRQKIRGIHTGKQEVRLSLFADDRISFTENPKDFTKTLLELMNKIRKVRGDEPSAQKSVT